MSADQVIEECEICGGDIVHNGEVWVHNDGDESDHAAFGPVHIDPEADREALSQLAEFEAMPCPACGEPLDEQGFCNNIDCESRKI